MQQAAAAIRGGADPKEVRARLKQVGFDGSDLTVPDAFSDLVSGGGQEPLDGSALGQLGTAQHGFGPALVRAENGSMPHLSASPFTGRMPTANAISKRATDAQLLRLTAASQPTDPPENPFTHMMAAEEPGEVQPDHGRPATRGPDPYSEANLTLGPNEQYRADILAAARSYHLTPHAIAASIGGEVGGGRWNPNAENHRTHAVGLMQFLPNTWIGEANRRGSFLNGVAGRLGYLDRQGRLIPARTAQFLAVRNNPSISIWAGADYAAQNLNALKRDGFVRNVSPAALARYSFLAHHEGLGGARSFLRGAGNNYERAFRQNLSTADQARYLAANNNDLGRAYRNFFADYVDGRVDVSRYMVDRQGVAVPPTRSLLR